MDSYGEMLRVHLSNKLKELSWQCQGCSQVSVCEEQESGGESRYCWPIIEAAIMNEKNWDTEHWTKKE